MTSECGENSPKFYGAVIVGERGQIVIPAEARRELDINPGEKLIIMGGPKGNMLMAAKAEFVFRLLSEATEYMSRFNNIIKTDDEPAA